MITINIRFLLTFSVMLIAYSNVHAIPNFHLKNKSTEPIQVNVMQAGTSATKGAQSIGKDQALALDLNDKKVTIIELFFCPTASWCKTKLPRKLTAQCAPGETMYIKFNGSKLEPQKGDLFGKTTEGYVLSNNVKLIKQSVSDSTIGYPDGQKPTAFQAPTNTKTTPQTNPKGNNDKEQQLTQAVTSPNQPQTKSANPTAVNQQKSLVVQVPQISQELIQEGILGVDKTPYTSQPMTQMTQKTAHTLPPEMVGITGPIMPNAQASLQTQGAPRIAPTAPASSKKTQIDLAAATHKARITEDQNKDKMSPAESETIKQPEKELAWQVFPEANTLRKKLKNGEQSPFVARKVLALNVGATESEIKKSAQKYTSFYLSSSYEGDSKLKPEIVAIISNAEMILIDAIHPQTRAATVSPFAQELQKELYAAPEGHEDFAAPLYQDVVGKDQYSREFLQAIQKKVMSQKGLPEKWRQSVLSKIQRLLSQIK